MEPIETKLWYQSKTVWFNIGTILVVVAAELTPLLGLFDAQTEAALTPLVLLAAAVGNILLRAVTTKPLSR